MTANQIDARLFDDSELGRHLLTARGLQWAYGCYGDDPYAMVARAFHDDDAQEYYDQVRARGPVFASRMGAWVTGSHAVGSALLADSRLGIRHKDGAENQELFTFYSPDELYVGHLLSLDDAFMCLSPAQYEQLPRVVADTAEIEDICHAFLGRLSGGFDLMADFARPYATAVAAHLHAVPADRRAEFARLTAGASVALDALLCPQKLTTTRTLVSSIDDLRKLLGPDDAPAMLNTVVGVEVTANLVCNAMLALLANQDQWAALRSDPGLAPAAVEETLRHDPPVRLESRIAHEDIELAGHTIDAGRQVVVVTAAANRDPEMYPEPDRFDLHRTPSVPHLGLGGRLYASYVAPLARTQTEIALRGIAQALPAIRREGAELRRIRAAVVRGIHSLPVAAG